MTDDDIQGWSSRPSSEGLERRVAALEQRLGMEAGLETLTAIRAEHGAQLARIIGMLSRLIDDRKPGA